MIIYANTKYVVHILIHNKTLSQIIQLFSFLSMLLSQVQMFLNLKRNILWFALISVSLDSSLLLLSNSFSSLGCVISLSWIIITIITPFHCHSVLQPLHLHAKHLLQSCLLNFDIVTTILRNKFCLPINFTNSAITIGIFDTYCWHKESIMTPVSKNSDFWIWYP